MTTGPKLLRLDDPTARLKLELRQAPYWQPIVSGLALGYRAGERRGHWLCRMQNSQMNPQRKQVALGDADDTMPSDGRRVLSFLEALDKARALFRGVPERHWTTHPKERTRPLLVRDAVMDYLAMLEINSKSPDRARQMATCHILSNEIADIHLKDLTTADIVKWHQDIANHQKMTRAGREKSGGKWLVPNNTPEHQEAKRARKATANRVLGILKAALTYTRTLREELHLNESIWRDARKFKGVKFTTIRALPLEEQTRLVDACEPGLKELVQGALLTGARYSELATLRVNQLDLDRHTFNIPAPLEKTGESTDIPLSDEAVALLRRLIQGKGPKDFVFLKANGDPWGRNHQTPLFKKALQRAGLPDMRWHELRHSFAVRMLSAGLPGHLVSKALGHADNRMLEEHYGKFLKEWIVDAFKRLAPKEGLLSQSEPEGPGRSKRVKKSDR